MKFFFIILLLPVIGLSQKQSGGFASLGGSLLIKNSATLGTALALGVDLSKHATLGIGGEYYQFKGAVAPYIPIFFHLKWYMNDRMVRPYLTFAPGYGVYNGERTSGGPYFATSLGAHLRNIKKPKQVGLYLQAGVKFISFKTTYGFTSLTPVSVSTDVTEYFSLDFGFRF